MVTFCFGSTMALDKYQKVIKHLRFDEYSSRSQKRQADKSCLIFKISFICRKINYCKRRKINYRFIKLRVELRMNCHICNSKEKYNAVIILTTHTHLKNNLTQQIINHFSKHFMQLCN